MGCTLRRAIRKLCVKMEKLPQETAHFLYTSPLRERHECEEIKKSKMGMAVAWQLP